MDFITGVWNALHDTTYAIIDGLRVAPSVAVRMAGELDAVAVPLIMLGALLIGWVLNFTLGWRRG